MAYEKKSQGSVIMLIRLIRIYIPGFIKKYKLKCLFYLTADAFRVKPPRLKGLNFKQCLKEYALFTREQAEKCLRDARNVNAVKDRLYHNACLFGQSLRNSLHVKNHKEAAAVLEIVYGMIGIDFRYDEQGSFLIRECYFSNYYSGEICRLIASLDEGIAAGLSGGCRLSFTQRLTEGCDFCKGIWNNELV